MKYNHEANFCMAVTAAIVGAVINYGLWGNFLAAALGAGPVTFFMSLAFNYSIDWLYDWKERRTNKR